MSLQQESRRYWLLVQSSNIVWQAGLPFGTAAELGVQACQKMRVGTWHGAPLWLAVGAESEREFVSLRSLLPLNDEDYYALTRGVEIHHFLQTHRFCGKCGGATQLVEDELAVQCSACGYRAYPVICPSIIVAVRRDGEILLANHRRHYNPNGGGMYTTLAGFVEVGETFEQAVAREVFEETSIRVKNLQYFGSQPWPFPNSQMVGFLAEYDSGEIRLQESEIADARWFALDAPLPELPPTGTIALELIKATIELYAKEKEKQCLN